MKHHILVKFNDTVPDKAALSAEVADLFQGCTALEWVHGVSVHTSVVDRPNRYDLMIVLDMDQAALDAYDHSQPHLVWKRDYGQYVAAKAIFDCD